MSTYWIPLLKYKLPEKNEYVNVFIYIILKYLNVHKYPMVEHSIEYLVPFLEVLLCDRYCAGYVTRLPWALQEPFMANISASF